MTERPSFNDAQANLLARIKQGIEEQKGLRFACGQYNVRGGADVRCAKQLAKKGYARFTDEFKRWVVPVD